MKKPQKPNINPRQARALEELKTFSSSHVIGIDEVGIGCLAGPVVVAGIAVPKDWSHPSVKDSKKMTKRQRMVTMQQVIYEQELPFCMVYRSADNIDKEGVRACIEQLTEGAALYLRRRFPDAPVVQDGELPVSVDGSMKGVITLAKADALVQAVSAASIVAKVSRDEYMVEQARLYPWWGFEKNMGYPSLEHAAAIQKYGLCPLHRLSYGPVKKYLAQCKGC